MPVGARDEVAVEVEDAEEGPAMRSSAGRGAEVDAAGGLVLLLRAATCAWTRARAASSCAWMLPEAGRVAAAAAVAAGADGGAGALAGAGAVGGCDPLFCIAAISACALAFAAATCAWMLVTPFAVARAVPASARAFLGGVPSGPCSSSSSSNTFRIGRFGGIVDEATPRAKVLPVVMVKEGSVGSNRKVTPLKHLFSELGHRFHPFSPLSLLVEEKKPSRQKGQAASTNSNPSKHHSPS